MPKYLEALRAMAYPGRVIIIGAEPEGRRSVVVYAITGRSPSSQARRLRSESLSIWTEPLDEKALKEGNPDLLIYRALALDAAVVVSNGRQTEDIIAALSLAGAGSDPGAALSQALRAWTYEPDAPHFTPRISGCVARGGRAALSVIRRAAGGEEERLISSWNLEPGRARLVATYSGREENPLPAFSGGPRDVELREDTARGVAEAAFDALAPMDPARDFRVSVVCLFASLADLSDPEISVINHRERQSPHGKDR